jgi:hypothetical protein
MTISYSFACPTRDALLAIADEWSVSDAGDILGQVTAAAASFTATASKLRVRAGNSLETVRADIDRRLTLVRGRS